MKRILYVVCTTVFVVGLVTFSRTQTVGPESARPYSVVTAHYHIAADGSKINRTERIRYVTANGEWRQGPYDSKNPSTDVVIPNKESAAVFAGTEDGFFATAPGRPERKSISGAPDEQMKECFRSVKCLRGQMTFARIDEVAGFQVYVLRTNVEEKLHPIEWTEESYSPKTGYLPLRTVRHFRDGSEDVMEATKVEFRDVPENLNDDIKAMPTRK